MTDQAKENIEWQQRCPYTLKLLNELEKTSREHIILDALGGPNGYSVRACEEENNEFGQTFDARFLEDPSVAIPRTTHGIESRSGTAKLKLRGTTVEGGRPVDITLPHSGAVEVYHRNPVDIDIDGRPKRIVATEGQSQELLTQMEANLKNKGMSIGEVKVERSENQELHLQASFNLTVIKAGLMKIAYLACFEYLGEDFLDDPLNGEWQKAIRASTAEEAADVKIHGASFDGAAPADDFFSDLGKHEHGITIVNLNQEGPIVVVRLFGSSLLTVFARASDSNDFGMPYGEGVFVICDATRRSISREPFLKGMIRKSGM
ncbi:MAG: hypothetical protein QM496_16540 [Verrucomicrobiota bacterium]